MNPQRSSEQVVMAVIGFAMTAMSMPCVAAMIHDIITQADNLNGALIVGGFMGFVGIAGLIMMYLGMRKPKPKKLHVTEALERRVLQVARQHRGRVTLSELTLETSLSLDQCRSLLTHFESNELARTHLSEDGDIIYVFPHFDSLDKSAAIDPLNDHMVFDAALKQEADEEVVLSQPQESKQEDW